ncbi:MAG: protein translocase subunit SecD [Elusimicrobiota bacterium]|jgi:protein-export membrane protein SecD|nr:protein translocase subunit SecD [Elusimicrobiota bacterium]
MSKINWKFLFTIALLAFSVYAIAPSIQWYRMTAEKKEAAQKDRQPILSKILKLGLDLKGGSHLLLEVDASNLDATVKMSDAVDRAIEIIRNRVDQFGVAEPLIARQGDRWIVVQLPGIKDANAAKELIGKTALLEFRVVNTSDEANKVIELLRDKNITPAEYRANPSAYSEITKIMPEGASAYEDKERSSIYILDKAQLTGAYLVNAKVEFTGQFGQPIVGIEFNKDGAKIFSDVTDRYRDRQLAIVLDSVVQSAPVIRARIPDGRAIIEGNFNQDDAKLLATILRAGALPAPVRIIEERTVGPTLGDDSIKKGFTSAAVGVLAVLLFMLIYYRLSGVIANIALVLNLFILMAAMAYFQFTLTLPGVAGIALTLAMAVDANVLILERIREELKSGKSVRLAVETGYQKVFWTIFDANVTTLIAAVFLFQFGTGPIKGFAVTLSIGLIISMFTSIAVTKILYDFLFKENFLAKINI